MPAAARPLRSRARVILPALLLLAVLATAGWVVVRGALAKSELEAVRPLVTQARQALLERDVDRLDRIAATAVEHAARARDLTSDPVWRSLEALPALGANAAGVRVVATAVAEVASTTRPALAVLAEPPAASAGALLDLAQIEALQSPLDDAAAAFTDASAQIEALDPDGLIEPLSGAVRELSGLLGPMADGLHGAADAVRMMPAFLGDDGARNLLLLVQNPAELRTAGGVTGTYLLLRADAGELTLIEDRDASAFAPSAEPVRAVPAPTVELYGDRVATEAWNVTLASDFTVTAALARDWWNRHSAASVDAVISLDPVVLSALLTTIPPLTLPDGGVLDAQNVVPSLLSAPYALEGEAAQREYRRAVTTAAINGILRAKPDLLTLADALSGPLDEGRISMWSADGAEQAVIGKSALAGLRARHERAGASAFSVHLNDATTGKMDTLLHMGVGAGLVSCGAGERAEAAISVTLTSLATEEAVLLPVGVTGASNPARPGDIVTDVSVVAPRGWTFGAALADEKAVEVRDIRDAGLATVITRVVLAPGEARTLRFHFEAPGPTSPEPVLLHTPMVNEVAELPAPTACG